MTENEYFRKNYPDYCYGEKPLSPYWDLFEDGVEFGERQSEEKIKELKRNKKTVAHLAGCLEEKMKERIEELEKENAELKAHIKADCIDCADYIKIKKLEEENEELKERNKYKNKACVKLAHQANVARDNLDEAKEIIKELLSCCRNYPQENAEKMEQAEQFIKEIEK